MPPRCCVSCVNSTGSISAPCEVGAVAGSKSGWVGRVGGFVPVLVAPWWTASGPGLVPFFFLVVAFLFVGAFAFAFVLPFGGGGGFGEVGGGFCLCVGGSGVYGVVRSRFRDGARPPISASAASTAAATPGIARMEGTTGPCANRSAAEVSVVCVSPTGGVGVGAALPPPLSLLAPPVAVVSTCAAWIVAGGVVRDGPSPDVVRLPRSSVTGGGCGSGELARAGSVCAGTSCSSGGGDVVLCGGGGFPGDGGACGVGFAVPCVGPRRDTGSPCPCWAGG
jgi:hypothetical protein